MDGLAAGSTGRRMIGDGMLVDFASVWGERAASATASRVRKDKNSQGKAVEAQLLMVRLGTGPPPKRPLKQNAAFLSFDRYELFRV